MLGDFFGHARLLGDVQRAQHAVVNRAAVVFRRCGGPGLRLLGGFSPREGCREKAYDARSAGDLCAFLSWLEALNAGFCKKTGL